MATALSNASAGQVIDTYKGSVKEQGEETSAASKDSNHAVLQMECKGTAQEGITATEIAKARSDSEQKVWAKQGRCSVRSMAWGGEGQRKKKSPASFGARHKGYRSVVAMQQLRL